MLQSIRIEGDILDWSVPVEIELGEIPTILTGRNGAGKTLVGNIIKTCTDYLYGVPGDKHTKLERQTEIGELFQKIGIERVVFNFETRFYHQYNNKLMTNLPILFALDPNLYPDYRQTEMECWDFELDVKHHSKVEFSFDHSSSSFGFERFADVQKLPKIITYQSLKVDATIDSLFEWEDIDQSPLDFDEWGCLNLDFEIKLNPSHGLVFDGMVHESVVDMKKEMSKYGLNMIVFDNNIVLDKPTDSSDGKTFTYVYDIDNLKNMFELKQLKEKVPYVSHYFPDFEFPDTITGWGDERIEVFEFPEYVKGFLDVEFIPANRSNTTGIVFRNEEDFEINNYGYFDLSLAWGEKFDIPNPNYHPNKLPKKEMHELIEFWDQNFPKEPTKDPVFHYRLMGESEVFDSLSSSLKSNLHEFICWHWWNRTVPKSYKTQIILHHMFEVKFESLSDPLPSGINNLAILIETVLNSSAEIIFIDEPEISLHIDWQAKIIEALRLVGKISESKLIFTTHSPDIVVNNLQYVYHLPPLTS